MKYKNFVICFVFVFLGFFSARLFLEIALGSKYDYEDEKGVGCSDASPFILERVAVRVKRLQAMRNQDFGLLKEMAYLEIEHVMSIMYEGGLEEYLNSLEVSRVEELPGGEVFRLWADPEGAVHGIDITDRILRLLQERIGDKHER